MKLCNCCGKPGNFQRQRAKCNACRYRQAQQRATTREKRLERDRVHAAKLRAANRILPLAMEAVKSLVDGDSERAQRLAKQAYAKALAEGVA